MGPANKPAPNVLLPVMNLHDDKADLSQTPYFTPAQDIPAGTAADPQPDGKAIPKLFQPLKLRGLTLQNRIMVSPMFVLIQFTSNLVVWY